MAPYTNWRIIQLTVALANFCQVLNWKEAVIKLDTGINALKIKMTLTYVHSRQLVQTQ